MKPIVVLQSLALNGTSCLTRPQDRLRRLPSAAARTSARPPVSLRALARSVLPRPGAHLHGLAGQARQLVQGPKPAWVAVDHRLWAGAVQDGEHAQRWGPGLIHSAPRIAQDAVQAWLGAGWHSPAGSRALERLSFPACRGMLTIVQLREEDQELQRRGCGGSWGESQACGASLLRSHRATCIAIAACGGRLLTILISAGLST